jgi:hypothetical protein
MEQIQSQIQKEYHTTINPFHVWLNVLSLCIFPVIAQPLIREIFQLPEEAYKQILEQRKTEVPQFIMNALNVNNNHEEKEDT